MAGWVKSPKNDDPDAKVWRKLRELTLEDAILSVRRLPVVWIILGAVVVIFAAWCAPACREAYEQQLQEQREQRWADAFSSASATVTAEAVCESEVARGQRQEC